MFLDELSPIIKELKQDPTAFLGGFFSGVLKLNLTDDPVKSWLDKQANTTSSNDYNDHNGNGSGPQSITIE